MKYKAVLFDLDGTILNTAPGIMKACNHTLTKFGFAPVDESVIKSCLTAGMSCMLKLGVPENQWDSAGVDTVMKEEFASFYTDHMSEDTCQYDGIGEFIQRLSDNGIRTAVVTNKRQKMSEKILKDFFFSKHFEFIVSTCETARAKPYPDGILKALDLLDISAQDTLYIGDHINDIKAAKAAGCDSAAASWGYGEFECGSCSLWGADFIAHSVSELSSIIFDKI
ncbi:MAG: HAD family hydrolase [Succinivibrio sp.]